MGPSGTVLPLAGLAPVQPRRPSTTDHRKSNSQGTRRCVVTENSPLKWPIVVRFISSVTSALVYGVRSISNRWDLRGIRLVLRLNNRPGLRVCACLFANFSHVAFLQQQQASTRRKLKKDCCTTVTTSRCRQKSKLPPTNSDKLRLSSQPSQRWRSFTIQNGI